MSPDLRSFLTIVHLHYSRNRGVDYYAQKLGLDPEVLDRTCKKELGISAQEVVKDKFDAKYGRTRNIN